MTNGTTKYGRFSSNNEGSQYKAADVKNSQK